MSNRTGKVTAQQVIDDWYASLAPRDPYYDLGVLIREVNRLRQALYRHRKRVVLHGRGDDAHMKLWQETDTLDPLSFGGEPADG